MSYKKLVYTKNQHTVPKCYLKNFSEDGHKIFRKLKKIHESDDAVNNEIQAPVSLKKATVQSDFYSVKSGREPMMVETLFYSREVENHYPKIYDLLVNPKIAGFNMEERSRILMCLLSLHCRTPRQFQLFFDSVKVVKPNTSEEEIFSLKEDYKGLHLSKVLTNFIGAHQFKMIRIAKIADNSEFITSDNPLLIINSKGQLKNHKFREQFNVDNKIVIPLDRKHCCILTTVIDKNGISLNNKVFFNRIERIEVNASFAFNVNLLMLRSAEKYYFGAKKYMQVFFSFVKLR